MPLSPHRPRRRRLRHTVLTAAADAPPRDIRERVRRQPGREDDAGHHLGRHARPQRQARRARERRPHEMAPGEARPLLLSSQRARAAPSSPPPKHTLPTRNLNVAEAKTMMIATLRWRDEFNVEEAVRETFPADVFGKLGYIYGKDKQGRPVTYVRQRTAPCVPALTLPQVQLLRREQGPGRRVRRRAALPPVCAPLVV